MDYFLSEAEQLRYHRHLILSGFGIEAQKKLKSAKVLVVGAGGLGCPLLLYLAAAGVGCIGIIDFDTIDISNLQRQVLFTAADVGKSKANVACERLLQTNPHIEILAYPYRLSSKNAIELIQNYDIIADGSDNFSTRYLVNDACILAGKPNVYASIFKFEGQVSVFNYPVIPQNGVRSAHYRDIFPVPPPAHLVPNCAEAGVLGVLPGIIGSMQANEVIKIITGIGEPLAGRLFLIDTLSFMTRTLKISINPAIQVTNLPDDNDPKKYNCSVIHNISSEQLKDWIAQKIDFQLVDVRTEAEHRLKNLGGELIPLATLEQSIERISQQKNVVIYCQSGQRSQQAIQLLQKKYFFKNLYNLAGGINNA